MLKISLISSLHSKEVVFYCESVNVKKRTVTFRNLNNIKELIGIDGSYGYISKIAKDSIEIDGNPLVFYVEYVDHIP